MASTQNTSRNATATAMNVTQSVSPMEAIEQKEEKGERESTNNDTFVQGLLRENADLKLKIEQLQAYINPHKVISEAFFAFTNGHFNGSQCRHFAAQYYS